MESKHGYMCKICKRIFVKIPPICFSCGNVFFEKILSDQEEEELKLERQKSMSMLRDAGYIK